MPFEAEGILRLLLAAALGAAVGYQREKVGKPAGFRTHSLISFGAALFTIASIQAFGVSADPSRVAAGIVTGIGFLGAGAIIHREGGIVEGLTTAATIWSVAAIGLAAGTGLYLIAVAATAIILLVLFLPHPMR
ncbi:MAG: MgtC/SapB family protein [Chloroflexi bacterium]|nr:MgtC/SapB family protein [Chloroflexota bacterium]